MVRYALLAIVLVTCSAPSLSARQDAAGRPGPQASAPAPAPDAQKAPIETSASTGLLTRAVEDVHRQVPSSTRPSAWVDTTVAPAVHTWMPRPQWERLWLTVPEEFRGGLLYTGGMPVYPWPRFEWSPGLPLGAKVSTQPASRPVRD
jgi:hypothetical protein